MSDDDARLLNLAAAILDGDEPDWATLESSASDTQRAVFAELRAVAAIGSLRRRDPALPLAVPPRPLDGLATWGALHLLEPIGQGNFGTVYRAWDPHLDREVALKLLPADAGTVAALSEGRYLAKIRHPNVVTIFGADRIGDYVGFWMEFVRGETLDQQVKRAGRFSAARVAAVGRQLCAALAAVHAAGLVHRDVKGHNVMIESGGRVVLMDFGAGGTIAGNADGLAGTPLYLAPEVLAGHPATPRSDLYSAGVLLYYLIAGAYPVAGRTLREIRDAHRRGEAVPPIARTVPGIPRRLGAAIDRALAIDPGVRFAAADEMASALEPAAAIVTWKAAAAVLALATGGALAVAAGALPGARFFGRSSSVDVAGPTAPGTRRLSLPDWELVGSGLSRDGRIFAYLDSESRLVAYDMTSGGVDVLVAADGEQFPEFCVTAPDGGRVAYEWWTDRGAYELRLVDRRTKQIRVLLQDDGLDQLLPVDWSREGSSLLVWLKNLEGRGRLALVDVESGAIETIRDLSAESPLGASLSPDGRYVAYDLPKVAGRSARILHVVDRFSGRDQEVATSPAANDRYPLWTPDGRHLFFISDRSGSSDGWIVPIDGGVAAGDPSLIVRNLGRVSSLGLTDKGAFYYRLSAGVFEVLQATVDPQTTTLSPPARVAAHFTASNIGPAYAPDGKHLSYISVRDALGGAPVRTIVIKDLVTGDERELNPPFDLGNSPARWSPDGDRLLVGSRIIDAATGALLHAFNPRPGRDISSYGPVRWDPGGRSVVFEREGVGLVRHRLDGGADVPLYRYSPTGSVARIHRFEIAPDGRTIAVSADLHDGATMLAVVSAQGEVELARRRPPEVLTVQGWSPDGTAILFTTFRAGAQGPHELWRIGQAGSSPERLGTINGATQINPVAISPNGSAIAFTTGTPGNEIWMMEHFLPR